MDSVDFRPSIALPPSVISKKKSLETYKCVYLDRDWAEVLTSAISSASSAVLCVFAWPAQAERKLTAAGSRQKLAYHLFVHQAVPGQWL